MLNILWQTHLPFPKRKNEKLSTVKFKKQQQKKQKQNKNLFYSFYIKKRMNGRRGESQIIEDFFQ